MHSLLSAAKASYALRGFLVLPFFWLLCAPLHAADLTARQVTEMFYKARSGAPVDLSGKDLSFLDLAGIDFKGALLSGANLYGVDLKTANLKGSHLAGVRLDRAAIEGTDFSGANLERASMLRPSVYTRLGINSASAPKFAGANLRHIRLTAMMDGADFRGADLTVRRWGRMSRVQISPACRRRG